MLNRLILKVTKFRLPHPKRLSTVIKNILGSHHGPQCQIGLSIMMDHLSMLINYHNRPFVHMLINYHNRPFVHTTFVILKLYI